MAQVQPGVTSQGADFGPGSDPGAGPNPSAEAGPNPAAGNGPVPGTGTVPNPAPGAGKTAEEKYADLIRIL
ncbi:MAG TPA: hypothetical protein VIL22_08830, partial [Paenibacillaceae bacterium]